MKFKSDSQQFNKQDILDIAKAIGIKVSGVETVPVIRHIIEDELTRREETDQQKK